MTVKELKEALSQYPDDMRVFVAERVTEYEFGLVNGIGSQHIYFGDDDYDDDDNNPVPNETVVVIGET